MAWTDWAKEELKKAGWLKKDSPYQGNIGKAVKELVEVFGKQNHSGFSARLTAELFYRLVSGKPLTPVTNDMSEWEEVGVRNEEKLFQSKKCASVFATESQLKEGKAKDTEYYYKVDKNGASFRDRECIKLVDLPYYPPTYPMKKE